LEGSFGGGGYKHAKFKAHPHQKKGEKEKGNGRYRVVEEESSGTKRRNPKTAVVL